MPIITHPIFSHVTYWNTTKFVHISNYYEYIRYADGHAANLYLREVDQATCPLSATNAIFDLIYKSWQLSDRAPHVYSPLVIHSGRLKCASLYLMKEPHCKQFCYSIKRYFTSGLYSWMSNFVAYTQNNLSNFRWENLKKWTGEHYKINTPASHSHIHIQFIKIKQKLFMDTAFILCYLNFSQNFLFICIISGENKEGKERNFSEWMKKKEIKIKNWIVVVRKEMFNTYMWPIDLNIDHIKKCRWFQDIFQPKRKYIFNIHIWYTSTRRFTARSGADDWRMWSDVMWWW